MFMTRITAQHRLQQSTTALPEVEYGIILLRVIGEHAETCEALVTGRRLDSTHTRVLDVIRHNRYRSTDYTPTG